MMARDDDGSRGRPRPSPDEEAQIILRLMARERLSIDDAEPGRTCFLSHLGAQGKLVPGPWIAHRDLLYALALANLNPAQRTSLARAVLVEHGREFGVGRLRLETLASGLPLGGSSLRFRPRAGGPTCLYTWALGTAPTPAVCDWLILRAQPQWAREPAPRVLEPKSLATLVDLGAHVLVLVETAVAALQIAELCRGKIELAAHPRFAPFIEGIRGDASVLLWPHDALDAAGLRGRSVDAILLVDAPEHVRQDAEAWRGRRPEPERVELREVACPGRAGRAELASFWAACGRPRVLLTGDPAWTGPGRAWLENLGATVVVQGEATQLELL